MKKNLLFTLSVIISLSLIPSLQGQDDNHEPENPKGQLLNSTANKRTYQSHKNFKNASNASTATVLFEENFEGETTSLTIESDWAVGEPSYGPSMGYLSTNCAGTVLEADYNTDSDYRLITSDIELPELTVPTAQIELRFFEWFQIESGYDFGIIEVSNDNGSTWVQLDTRSGVADWIENTVLLTAYAGQTIKIAFRFTSDNAYNYAGWYIDNITVQSVTPSLFNCSLNNLNSQNFPFIYMNVAVDSAGAAIEDLDENNFIVYENMALQTNYFEVIPPSKGEGSRLADIIFIVDNSGSFDDYQAAVYNNMVSFINQLKSSDIDYALGLCRFGQSSGYGDPILVESGQLTTDADYFKETIWSYNTAVGRTEPAYYAITQSISGFTFRPGSQKIFIILADEYPNQGGSTQQEAIDALNQNSATLFSLTTAASEDLNTVAEQANGRYYNITDPFNDILNDISTTISSSYLIKYRSSDPYLNGIWRFVDVEVNYKDQFANDTGSYVPGALPTIDRTDSTINFESQSWPEESLFKIEVSVKDRIEPYTESVKLYYKNSLSPLYTEIRMTQISDTLWSAHVPIDSVSQPGLDYYITATDGAGTSSLPKVTPSQKPFQIAILPNYKPLIQHSLITEFYSGNNLIFDAQISDSTSTIDSIAFFYRTYGQLSFNAMDMQNKSGINYTYEIQTSASDTLDIEYYIAAWDNFGVKSSIGNADYPVVIKHKVKTVKKITSINDANRSSFTVFPNPSNGKFTITLNDNFRNSNIQVKIINSVNQEIFSNSYNIVDNRVDIAIPEISSAVYYLIIENDNYFESSTLIIR